MSDTTDNFIEMLEANLAEMGSDLEASSDEVRLAAAEQINALSLAVNEPGYARAVVAARDVIALKLGMEAVENADGLDQRILGFIQGGLFLAAKAVSPA